MDYFAGIDFGTSGARLVVIDPAGQICDQASFKFDQNTLDFHPEKLAQMWSTALFTLMQDTDWHYRQEMRAIAINGTSATVLLCDATGQPITPPLLYNDASGKSALAGLEDFFAQPQPIEATATPSVVQDNICRDNVLNATSSLVKLLWWQQQPFYSQARYLLHQADWLGFLLHGQLGVSDYHNSLKLGYDVAQLRYPEWMAALHVLPLLPQVLPPGHGVGPVQAAIAQQFHLPATCQICTGTTDSIAAFLASGATTPGTAVTSLGSTLVLKLLSDTPVNNRQYGIYSHRFGDRWLVGGASNTGGAVLKQFFSTAELIHLSQQIDPQQASALDYYPLPGPGERFPINDPQLLPRLDPQPGDRVAFLQGLLEGMARIEAQGYHLLQDWGATPLTQVYTAGGGAANPSWTALRARYLGVPVGPASHTDAAYGTALLALRSRI
jgi:D-ribulokinase